MIVLKLIDHDYNYEVSDILRMYFGKSEIRSEEALADSQSFLQSEDYLVISALCKDNGKYVCTSEISTKDRNEKHSEILDASEPSQKDLKRLIKKSMYKLMTKVFDKEFPWGILTGIRPVKIVHDLLDKGFPKESIINRLQSEYLMSRDRAELSLEIANIERPFIYPMRDNSLSLYIGIPFCPSRCHYCSFTSNPISRFKDSVDTYVESLMKEIKEVSNYLNNEGFSVQTVYIGGGTPTVLNEIQLKRLIDCINNCFSRSFEEFTCEAGRPDSINAAKLQAMKAGGVTRISINPQTMKNETLRRIGRVHSTESVLKSFAMAREAGFRNINMDMIVGLPGEKLDSVAYTLDEIKKLAPDSVTVHTMAIKRASVYNEHFKEIELPDDDEVSAMMEYTKEFLRGMNMHPYYLYRQKHMLQNLENIGFSRKGLECIYNMQIIEEKQTIVAFGADAVTKVVIGSENRIERQHNIKDVKLYINNVDEMIKKKIEQLKIINNTIYINT
ncbi:MAG: coproporphyrinogen dehydrogenase HemZ [Caulobacteraceae bacterium]